MKFDPYQCKKGEMPYICRLHPVMEGVLVVK